MKPIQKENPVFEPWRSVNKFFAAIQTEQIFGRKSHSFPSNNCNMIRSDSLSASAPATRGLSNRYSIAGLYRNELQHTWYRVGKLGSSLYDTIQPLAMDWQFENNETLCRGTKRTSVSKCSNAI